jgi:hypothetical protein
VSQRHCQDELEDFRQDFTLDRRSIRHPAGKNGYGSWYIVSNEFCTLMPQAKINLCLVLIGMAD